MKKERNVVVVVRPPCPLKKNLKKKKILEKVSGHDLYKPDSTSRRRLPNKSKRTRGILLKIVEDQDI